MWTFHKALITVATLDLGPKHPNRSPGWRALRLSYFPKRPGKYKVQLSYYYEVIRTQNVERLGIEELDYRAYSIAKGTLHSWAGGTLNPKP